MTQQTFGFDSPVKAPAKIARRSARDRVALLFLRAPKAWWDIADIIRAGGGLGGWRTEVSRCHTELHMEFYRRETRAQDGTVICVERKLKSAPPGLLERLLAPAVSAQGDQGRAA